MNIPRFRSILCQKRFLSNICEPKVLFTCRNTTRPLIHNLGNTNHKLVSTYDVKSSQKDEGVFQKFLKKIPFLRVDRIKTKASGYLLYEAIVDKIDYFELFQKYDLPDTFYSWFVITEVHIWMLSARAMAEGEQGHILRNSIVEALWADVARRTKKLGAANPAATRAQIQELSEQLQAAFIAYDEGLQSDDIVLAGAVWRRFYQMKYAAPYNIEEIVRYIRRHISLLDSLSKEQILDVEDVKWEQT